MSELIVDLHLHSHYSRATSKEMNIAALYRWGKIKGIQVLGTGDFTHPAWLEELQQRLEPAEPGLFRLRPQYAELEDRKLPESVRSNQIRFVLTVEISTIYSAAGRVRKIHTVVALPSFESAFKLNTRSGRVGNLVADGRPTLGMTLQDLVLAVLEADERAIIMPAHVWTPWFGVFGSKSGFDSLEEALGELKQHVTALETGLSSDPYMNRRQSWLDGFSITSHSDAHSPRKLGREATVVQTDFDYFQILDVLRRGDERLVGTIEFFPEEGKYHLDGHRACGIKFTAEESRAHNLICPVCGRPLTLGVEYRIDQLADRPAEYRSATQKQVEYIVPLDEILMEIAGVKGLTKKVQAQYDNMIAQFGNEFDLLRTVPVEKVRESGFEQLALGLQKLRAKEVQIDPGYDGVYGTVKIFGEKKAGKEGQLGFGL